MLMAEMTPLYSLQSLTMSPTGISSPLAAKLMVTSPDIDMNKQSHFDFIAL
jgi:hypothetical protein